MHMIIYTCFFFRQLLVLVLLYYSSDSSITLKHFGLPSASL